MKRTLSRKVLGFLIPVLIFSSCEAPRENPLDPNNPDSQYGMIEGYVKTESVPRAALSDVTVFDEDGNILAQTNTSGYFKINNIQTGSYLLYFEKTGYKKDTLQINWNGLKKIAVEEYLNQIPHLDSLLIYSVVISRYSLPPLVQLVVKAKITDSDKDLDSMIVSCDAVGFTEYLSYNTNDKYYSKETYLYDMPVSDLEEMIGKEIKIFAKESNGDKNVVGSGSLKRVITEAIDYIRPANYDTVSAKPLLEWYDYEAGYSFSQNIEVYSYELDFSNVLVWQRINLPSDSLSVTIDKDLPDGNYFWVIYCIDEFSNRIRSNPASFYIKNPSTVNK
ncbi:MAG: carboxypeptidase-like regulatory domain-containing protein [Ignavibacteriaceae bacterium]